MDSSRQPLIKVENLTKKYLIKKGFFSKEFFTAVDSVSFQLNNGQVLGLVGESGSGKSTIGKLIINLIKPDNGKILYNGKDITHKIPKDLRKEISIIFQDPRTSLNPRFKIYDILEEPLIVHNVPKKDRKDIIIETIRSVELDETFLDRYPHELSGGQRQRVAIARSIVLNPKLIIADEPTSALDVTVQLQILNLLEKLKNEKKISFIFISHDLNVVGKFSDYIVVLYKGKIMEKGTKKEILDSPLHPYTKLLFESLPPYHPKFRKPLVNFIEQDEESFDGCEFYSRCPIKKNECKTKPKYKNIDCREVYCYFV